MDAEPDKARWLARGNLEELPPYKWFKLPQKRATPSELAHVSFRMYFAPNKRSTCFTNFHLFAEIFLQRRQEPGPCF